MVALIGLNIIDFRVGQSWVFHKTPSFLSSVTLAEFTQPLLA